MIGFMAVSILNLQSIGNYSQNPTIQQADNSMAGSWPPQGESVSKPVQPQPKDSRPTLITILAILSGIGAAGTIVAALAAITISSTAAVFGDLYGGLGGSAIGALFLLLGCVLGLYSYGLWYGKQWAWWLGTVLYVISLIFGLLSLDIIGIIIDIALLYYFTRPGVKAYFAV